jgi:cytosolic carboxypeptidase protein 2/3
MAMRVKKNEYDCFIRSDTNTKGHTNWYYFKVSNKKYIGTVQFNVCNIVKRRNLYGIGMTPYSKFVEKGAKSN